MLGAFSGASAQNFKKCSPYQLRSTIVQKRRDTAVNGLFKTKHG